ncbi:MAG: MBL fold metallo-hydrolase [Rhodobacteraceae bacterium]|nr:MBL fold metallo-hydrolase [Paracoccaceae bacterium]
MKAGLAFGIALAMAAPFAVQGQDSMGMTKGTLENLGEDTYGWRVGTARSLIVVGEDGVLYVDPISPRVAKDGLAAVRTITDKPIKYVVYSHQHWDHILGAKVFKDEGATIVSHVACLKHFYRHPHPDLVLPDMTIESGDTLSLGNRDVQMLYFGPNHGDCLVVPWIKHLGMPFVVDLVTPGFIGIGLMPDYDPGEWVRSLKEIERLPFEQFIAGHATAISPKSVLAERRMFLEDIMAIVKREHDAGTPMDEVAAKIDLPQYKHLAGYGTSFPDFVKRLYTYYNIGW